jgi:dienelactone hydrolase
MVTRCAFIPSRLSIFSGSLRESRAGPSGYAHLSTTKENLARVAGVYDGSVKSAYALAFALNGCGDNVDSAVVRMRVGSAAPAYADVPFPTDAVRDGAQLGPIAGLDAIAKGQTDLIAQHLGALDGFGLRPVVEFFIDGGLDPTTVPSSTSAAADAVFVIDVATREVVAFDWRWDSDRSVLSGSPRHGVQLAEGSTYAAIVTDRVRGSRAPLLPDTGFYVATRAASGRWKSTADAFADARELANGRIVGIAAFTTQHASAPLVAARAVLAGPATPPPVLAFADPSMIFDTPSRLHDLLGDAPRFTAGPRAGTEHWGTDQPTGIAHDHVAVVATGTITVARFRGDATGGYGPDSKTFRFGSDGRPIVQAIEAIPISFVLPTAPVPPTGFPVVIFGHGLGGTRHDMLNLAEAITARGYAMVAIDMVGFGSRYPGDVDAMNNYAGKPDFTGVRAMPDGFGDDPGYAAYIAFFESFLNISAIRDGIRQSALDETRVAMLIQLAPDLSALAAPYGQTPTLDPTRVAYLGESFGTLVGTDVAAIEPSVDMYVLDVPGGGVIDQIVPNSPEIGNLAVPIVVQIYRTTGAIDRFHPLVGALQAVIDGADPLIYAPHVLRDRFAIAGASLSPRHVICIQAVTDEIMASQGTTALAYAFGLATLSPDLDPPPGLAEVAAPAAGNVDGQTALLVQYEPATHGFNWSAEHGQLAYQPGYPFPGDTPFPKLDQKVTIAEPIYATLDQVTQALAAHWAGGAPLVVSTQPAVRDYDGDGDVDDY